MLRYTCIVLSCAGIITLDQWVIGSWHFVEKLSRHRHFDPWIWGHYFTSKRKNSITLDVATYHRKTEFKPLFLLLAVAYFRVPRYSEQAVGWSITIQFPVEEEKISLAHRIENDSGVTQYPTKTGNGGRLAGVWNNTYHLVPKLRINKAVISTIHCLLLAWCVIYVRTT